MRRQNLDKRFTWEEQKRKAVLSLVRVFASWVRICLSLCFCRRAQFPAICNIWGPQTCHFACYLHHFGNLNLSFRMLFAPCGDFNLSFCMLFAHLWPFGMLFAHFWNLNLSVCMLLATFWDLNGLFRVCLGLTSGWFRIYLGFVQGWLRVCLGFV